MAQTQSKHREQQTTTNEFDKQFLEMMIPHHQGAVVMAEEVLPKVEHVQLGSLLANIITSQRGQIKTMQDMLKKWHDHATTTDPGKMPHLPGTTVEINMPADIQFLKDAKPAGLSFIDVMIPHHQLAVQACHEEMKHGENEEIKELCWAIVISQERQIGEMDTYRKLWFQLPQAPNTPEQ